MKIFSQIRRSVYDPEYYEEILTQSPWVSFRYFYSIVILLAFLVTVLASIYLVPTAVSFLQGIGPKVLSYYPEELTVTIQDGKVSTNVKEPYSVPFPEELKDPKKENPDNLIVIDTQNQFTIEGFKNYKTAALLTKDSMVGVADSGEIRIYPLVRAPNMKITKALVSSYIDKARPFLKFAVPLLVIGVFVFFMLYLGSDLLFLLFGAVVVLLVAKMKKRKISYGRAYQLSMHLITLGLIFDAIFLLAPAYRIGFLPTLAILVLAWINIKKGTSEASPLDASKPQ